MMKKIDNKIIKIYNLMCYIFYHLSSVDSLHLALIKIHRNYVSAWFRLRW